MGKAENRTDCTYPKGVPEAATSERLQLETDAASVCFYSISPFAPADLSDRFVPNSRRSGW